MKMAVIIFAFVFAALLQAETSQAGALKPYEGKGPTPPLVLKDLQGKEHDLNQFKGQVVLINFWATWCPPCRIEMPSLWRLKQKLKDKPFVILAVDMGEPESYVNAFLPDKMKRDFVVLMDKDGVALRAWNVFAFPTTYILDANGKIRYALFGSLEWDDARVVKIIRGLLP